MKKKTFITAICALFLMCILLPVLTSCQSDIDRAAKNLSVYDITAKFNDEDMTLSGEMDFKYVNTSDEPVSFLLFHLYGNAYRKDALFPPVASHNIVRAYPNGLSYGSMEVSAVKNNDANLPFAIEGEDKDILKVTLEKEVFPLENVTVSINFNLKLANVKHRLGYTDSVINMGNWYPTLCSMENGEYIANPYYSNGDPFVSDMANYNVKLELSKEYKAAFTGNVSKTTENGNTIIYEISINTVRDFAMAFSKNFETVSGKVENTTITYYYYNDENPNLALEYAVNAIKTFNELYGAYPYDTYSVVKTDFIYGGMEYPTIVLIAADSGAFFYETIVHETAHQWWYGLVGNNQLNQAWIDEGLSDYSTGLFYDKNPQYEKTLDSFVEGMANSYKNFVDVYKQVVKNANTTMNRNLPDYKTEYEYTIMNYNKGVIMLDEIRKNVGMEKFLKAVKKVYNESRFGMTSEALIKNIFASTLNSDIPSLMDSFIQGKVII